MIVSVTVAKRVLVVEVFRNIVRIPGVRTRVVLMKRRLIGTEVVRKLVVVTVASRFTVDVRIRVSVDVERTVSSTVSPLNTVTSMVSVTVYTNRSSDVTVAVTNKVVTSSGQHPSLEQAVGGVTVVQIVVFLAGFRLT